MTTTTGTRYETCAYRYSDGHLCGVFRMNHTGEHAAGHRFTEQQPRTTPPASGAGSERWYVSKVKNDVSVSGLKVDTTEIYVEDGRADWCAQVLRPERAQQIVNTMNQHSTLIEQRERLVDALRGAKSELEYWHSRYPGVNGPVNLDEAAAVLTTIEQEGETR